MRERQGEWGQWYHHPENGTVSTPCSPHSNYEIPLEDCGTPLRVDAWVRHIAGKPWAGQDTADGLVAILQRIARGGGMTTQQRACARDQHGEAQSDDGR